MILTLVTLFFESNSYAQNAQGYTLINEVIKYSKQDTIQLKDKFMIFDLTKVDVKFSKENIEELWTPMPHPDTPPIEPFLNNFNLAHFRADIIANKNDTLINFNLLNKRFIPYAENDLNKSQNSNSNRHNYTENLNKAHLNMSKPIFNCSKNWAIIITESFSPYYDVATSGYLNIYRKTNGKWVLYHKLELWMS